MLGLKRSQYHPIGLDIGHDSVKMIQLEKTAGTLSVIAAARGALPADAIENPSMRVAKAVQVIRQLYRQNAFRGRRIVATLPREMVHIRNIRLSSMPADQIDAAVRAEAKSVLPFDPAESQLEYLHVGEVRQGSETRQEFILIAARHYDVNAFIQSLTDCGLQLAALDIEPCALYRAIDRFIRRRDDEQDVHVLVDVGLQGSRLVIGKGREISLIKSIEIGGRHFQDAVARNLNITSDEAQSLRRRLAETRGPLSSDSQQDEADPVRLAAEDATRGVMEDLAREISRCLRYYSVTFRGPRPTRLRLVGGEATDPHLLAILDKMLGIPVEVAKPLLSYDTSRMKLAMPNETLCEWGMALGLALKCVEGTFGPRDGKPRDPSVPKLDLATDSADIPDLAGAFRSTANVLQSTALNPDSAAARTAAAYRAKVVAEVGGNVGGRVVSEVGRA